MGSRRGEVLMVTDAEMQNLRSLLAVQRHALVQTLCAAVAEERTIEPAYVSLLADTHTAIAAVDAALAEFATGDAS
jgi:hypothetical protein